MADQSAKPQARKKRRWLRRLVYSFLILLLLIVAFHRPIIHHGGRWIAIWLAKKQHMALELQIRGNIWNRLELHNVHIQAMDTGRAPIEGASLDRMAAEYDLWRLIKGDLGGLKSVDIGKGSLILTPVLDVDPEPPKPLAEKIRGFFSKPLPTPTVRLERFDLQSKEEKRDNLVIRGLHASIDPGKDSMLGWERIEIPGIPPIEQGTARVLLTGDRIDVSDVAIWPEVRIASLHAQRPQGDNKAEVALNVVLPEGKLTATVRPALDSNAFDVQASLETRGISTLAPRFGLTLPMVIESVSLEANWSGIPEQAQTSSGAVKFSASGRKDLVYPGWSIAGNLGLNEGTLSIQNVDARVAETTLTANGSFDARGTLAHQGPGKAPLPVGKLEFRLNAPDLQKAAAEFGQEARGQAALAGTVTTTSDAAQVNATLTGKNIGQKEITIGEINTTIAAKLPISDAPPLAVLSADVVAGLDQISAGEVKVDRVQLAGNLRQLQATLTELVATRGGNSARADGGARLKEAGELAAAPTFRFTIDAPVLADFGVRVSGEPLTGEAKGTGTLTTDNGKLSGTVQISAKALNAGPTKVGDIDLATTAARGQTTTKVTVKHGGNSLEANARATLDESLKLVGAPEVQFTIDAPNLDAFGVKVKNAPVTGTIKGTGTVSLADGKPNGNVSIAANDLRIGEAKAGKAVVDVVAENGAILIKSLRADLNANDYIEASGRIDLNEPRPYQGALALKVKDLAVFQPILEAIGEKKKLAGSIDLNWSGKGDLKGGNTGDGKLAAKGVRVDTLEISEAHVTTNYTPERMDVSEFVVVADQLRATGKMDWVDRRLNLRGLEVLLAGKPVITGDAAVPLDPFGKSVLPFNEPISASIAARNLDLARVFNELKLPPTVEGTLTATLTASGNLNDPVVKLDATGRGMRAPAPKDMTPEQRRVYENARGDFDLKVAFEDNRLKVDAVARHPDVKPLTVKVDAPLELKPILEGKMPEVKAIPFTASVELPSSSLAVVPKLSPAVAKIEGTAAISMQARGTINEPHLSGQITVNAPSIRMANGSIPPISNLGIRIGLAERTVTIQQFAGETGGGKLSIGGTIVANNLLEPVLDVRVRTDKVLAMRNDSVLVRVDSDVQLRGPWNAGTATGRVVLAQSRFNKEIQILPILMPGRPKPVPREVSQPVVVSFPNPPLRDWKFDIAIVTTNEDPFLVRGNLAKGQVLVDLKLQGTGLAPYLVGNASLEQFSAQLPVSRLTTRRGLVNFTQENPFEPRLEIESETVIRGYTIVARLEGPASSPRLDLTSEPPLPQQDIMTLLTTGGLSGELGDNNTALATRAGLMVLRDLYKKVFKKDLPVPTDQGGDNFFERFNVDLGAVDSRTGRQEITAQFRVTNEVVLVGDLEMGGGISGRIQYLFRFR